MLLFIIQNLTLINTFLIVLISYFMIGFVIYSIKKSDIKLLSAVADSVKKGARGRKDLLEQQASYESELMRSFLWPSALFHVVIRKLKNTKIVSKLRQLKNAAKKEN